MRNKFLLQPILWATVLFLFSCQKEVEKKSDNNQLISKINNWLDKQKSPTQPNKASNIDLLKENLDFPAMKFEDLSQSEQFIVMPIKETYKLKKNIDRNTIPVLLLVRDKTGNILRGNIVMYFPENNQPMNAIPDNTFQKMYSEKDLECSGLFRFLSPTGTWKYQRQYKNGKLKSFGYVRRGDAPERTTTDCTYYFLNLYFWEDGVIVAQETIYLGSICQSGGCDDPMNQTLCPDDGGGGGGGSGGGVGSQDDLIDTEAANALLGEVLSVNTQTSSQNISFSSQQPDESEVSFSWVVVKNAFGFWQVKSYDIAKGYNTPSSGAIINDIQHVNSEISGQTFWCAPLRIPTLPCLPFVNLSWEEISFSKSIASNGKSGTATVSGKLKNLGSQIGPTYTQSCTVSV